jgi:ATP-binding cassette subfamily B protein
MREVGFRYGNRAVIRGMSLDIRPGEMIGLVGHSGSGKSTLVNLICRFYDVTDGAIKVDGVDIRRFAWPTTGSTSAWCLQEPFLFFGTIAENIAYGKPDATREEIMPPRAPRMPTSSSCACRRATTRWWASAARACRAASASASRSRGRC